MGGAIYGHIYPSQGINLLYHCGMMNIRTRINAGRKHLGNIWVCFGRRCSHLITKYHNNINYSGIVTYISICLGNYLTPVWFLPEPTSDVLLSTVSLGIKYHEIWIKVTTFSIKKMHLPTSDHFVASMWFEEKNGFPTSLVIFCCVTSSLEGTFGNAFSSKMIV